MSTTTLELNAEALYATLRVGVRAWLVGQPDAVLVGIWSGGAWLSQRLQIDLQRAGEAGVVSSTLHRDDFAERGLSAGVGATKLPFAVDGQHILLIDDVLNTGRTIRAALNELYDFGRSASVTLAVLVDRGGRQLPIEAQIAAARVALPGHQSLALARDGNGAFSFSVEESQKDWAA